MLKRLVGLGIFALIFSLNLFALGTPKTVKPLAEVCAHISDTAQEQLEVSISIDLQEGILQSRSETNESQHTIRRFPLAVSVLFLLSHSPETQSPTHLLAALLSFSPPKDRLASYHILRI